MPDHMSKLKGGSGVGNHYPSFDEFKKSANPFGKKIRYGIGLLKVEMGAVENERDFFDQGEVKLLFQRFECFFGKKGPRRSEFFLFFIVIYLEMFCGQNMPVEWIISVR